MVGLLAGIGISSCNHQSFTQGGRYLSIPSCAIDLRISECNSFLRLLSSEMACLSSLRDWLRSIPASVAHLSLYVGINASDADLGLNGTNLWIYPSFNHDVNVARFANDIDSPFASLYISFPSAKDPDFVNSIIVDPKRWTTQAT